MTNEGILEIAMRQSAIDANCQAGSALTSRLALEVLDRGKVPFNGTAWSIYPVGPKCHKKRLSAGLD
jgi:hypothetical protein